MDIFEAKEAFIKQWNKVIEPEPGRITLEEQTTQLYLAVPGYDFTVYGGDSDEENLNYFLNLFCDYVHGETNIKTTNMIWFSVKTHIVLLWEKQED